MVRPDAQCHPYREPAAARAAATLLLLRDAADGYEVLMTQRSAKASFAPSMYVFPGGVQDADDPCLKHTALREAFEEVGILLAVGTGDLKRAESLNPQLAALGARLKTEALFTLAHWITDLDMPKRYDVKFYVARAPEGQEAVADNTEQFRPVWVNPRRALASFRANAADFPMIFPTIRTLERLAVYDSADAVLKACEKDAPLWTSLPRAGLLKGAESRHMEHEPPYGELALVCPQGQMTHHLDWQHEHAVPLLKHVRRLTAPNPSMMTGPGTNTYIVGEREFVVIDPGADIVSHIERIAALVGRACKAIVCTHSHPDHSPGAARLKALTGAPILGLSSAPTARENSRFKPERELADGEVLQVDDSRLRVHHTPGHAANHLCLELIEDGLLFSGDHVLNGSTTVVDPPDGHMGDYLRSLDKLAVLPVDFILPAHGYVLAPARAAIEKLKQHRLAREDKLRKARAAAPLASPEALVSVVYDDVDTKLHGIALRSMMAHWAHLDELAAEKA
jgi:recombination protein RecT